MPNQSVVMKQPAKQPTRETITFRRPTGQDGSGVWDLVAACPPLDQNSMYMNVVQCDHFAETCIIAERDGQLIGWISGHIPPENPQSLFVWQVAVHPDARGLGLGKSMLRELIARPACRGTRVLETTITRSNDSSWGLFRSFARDLGGELSDAPYYDRHLHLGGQHATEHLVKITLPRHALRLAA